MNSKPKRSGLSFMIPESLKNDFYKECEKRGSHASEEIRRFIKRSITSVKSKSKEENNTQVVVRLDEETRIDFVSACNSRDMTASYVIRKFIKNYLKKK